MATAIVRAHGYLKVRYNVPKNGSIEYEVEANRPVTTFVVDEEGLKEFNSKGSDVYSYYGGFASRYEHHQELRLPLKVRMQGYWYLIIDNPQNESVAVHYEVSTS